MIRKIDHLEKVLDRWSTVTINGATYRLDMCRPGRTASISSAAHGRWRVQVSRCQPYGDRIRITTDTLFTDDEAFAREYYTSHFPSAKPYPP